MRAYVKTTSATFTEAREKAIDAFDGFFGEGKWRFDGGDASPSLYVTGKELPELWVCEWDATNIDVRGKVTK